MRTLGRSAVVLLGLISFGHPPSGHAAPGPTAAGPPVPDAALLHDALVGTVAHPGDALDGRRQPRKVSLPHPGRGATAPFRTPDGLSGWITALPAAVVLPSPAYGAGKVYVGAGYGDARMFAFDAATGEAAWEIRGGDIGPTSAIVDGEDVIYNTISCDLFVADGKAGKVRWHRRLAPTIMSQPAAAGGLIFAGYPGGAGYQVGAFRVGDGKPRWTLAVPSELIAAPQVAGDSIYFATLDGTAFRVRRRDGHRVWKAAVGATSALAVAGDRAMLTRRIEGKTPEEQRIVLDTTDGRVVAKTAPHAAPYLDGASRDRVLLGGPGGYRFAPGARRLGLNSMNAGWAYQASPTIADGRVYAAVGNRLVATEIASGKDVWTKRYLDAKGAQALTPPAVVGSLLVFGTVDGQLEVADIDTGMIIRSWDLGEPIVAQPIVAQGWIYATTARGNLVGIDLGDPAIDGWHMWGGNPAHAGLVASAGTVEPRVLARLHRPGEGTLRGADGAPLPLVHTAVDATVSGFVADVTLTQTFANPHTDELDATYLFPLPEDAAIDRMEMRIGDRVVKGRIEKKQQAAATYDKAKQAGKRAALLEEQRPNLFTQRVANIPPGGKVVVTIHYAHVLPFVGGEYEYSFPMVGRAPLRPEGPGGDPGPARREARLRPRSRSRSTSHAGLPISRIGSPTHPIAVTRGTGTGDADVVLAPAGGEMANRDFLVRYKVSGANPRAAVLAHDDGDTGYFSLVVVPPDAPTAAQVGRRELEFVVDTSSSMHGRPMEQARAIVDRALAGLRPGDTFGLYGSPITSTRSRRRDRR